MDHGKEKWVRLCFGHHSTNSVEQLLSSCGRSLAGFADRTHSGQIKGTFIVCLGHFMQDTNYSAFSRLLHWVMALLILSMLPVGFLMVQPGWERSVQNALFIYHKNLGVLLLLLITLRLVWRLRHPAPPLPSTVPPVQVRAAHFSHLGLYVLMIVVPLAGYIRVRAGGFPIETLDALGAPALVPRSDALAAVAKSVHYAGGLALAALVAVHIGAALHHRLIKRDGIFQRMWPPFG